MKPIKAISASQMRNLDRLAQECFGIPELILMEHAGKAVALTVKELLAGQGSPCQGKVLVLSGGGANGGDGFVAARHLDGWGIPVAVAILSSEEKIRGASRINLEILRRLRLPVTFLPHPTAWDRWAKRQARPDRRGDHGHAGFRLIVDALLGTGLAQKVREPFALAIEWMNATRLPIVSVDLPSGLSADTGRPLPVAARATVTVTCGLAKKGLFTPAARPYVGRLIVADIGLPRRLTQARSRGCQVLTRHPLGG